MMYTTYVLYSESGKLHYTGYTSNMKMRLLSHNVFGKGWTSKFRPWKLVYAKEFPSKLEAMNYEKWLKSGVGRAYFMSLGVKEDTLTLGDHEIL
jgi:putative endonuclease